VSSHICIIALPCILALELVFNRLCVASIGTQRRPQKKTPHNSNKTDVSEDKKVKAAIKKFGK